MSTMRTVLTFAVSLRGSIVDHTFKNKQYKQQLYKTNDNNLHLNYNNYVKTTKNDK